MATLYSNFPSQIFMKTKTNVCQPARLILFFIGLSLFAPNNSIKRTDKLPPFSSLRALFEVGFYFVTPKSQHQFAHHQQSERAKKNQQISHKTSAFVRSGAPPDTSGQVTVQLQLSSNYASLLALLVEDWFAFFCYFSSNSSHFFPSLSFSQENLSNPLGFFFLLHSSSYWP